MTGASQYASASASLGALTCSFSLSVERPYQMGQFSEFLNLVCNPSWKIVWTPSFPGETPPTSAPVTFKFEGKNYIVAHALAGSGGGTASTHVVNTTGFLGVLRSVDGSYSWPSYVSPPTNELKSGLENETLVNFVTSDSSHPAQFNLVNGKWTAYVGVALNEGIVVNNDSVMGGGTRSWTDATSKINATITVVKVNGVDAVQGSGSGGSAPLPTLEPSVAGRL